MRNQYVSQVYHGNTDVKEVWWGDTRLYPTEARVHTIQLDLDDETTAAYFEVPSWPIAYLRHVKYHMAYNGKASIDGGYYGYIQMWAKGYSGYNRWYIDYIPTDWEADDSYANESEFGKASYCTISESGLITFQSGRGPLATQIVIGDTTFYGVLSMFMNCPEHSYPSEKLVTASSGEVSVTNTSLPVLIGTKLYGMYYCNTLRQAGITATMSYLDSGSTAISLNASSYTATTVYPTSGSVSSSSAEKNTGYILTAARTYNATSAWVYPIFPQISVASTGLKIKSYTVE
ncbi:MAG: hypothetical protein LUE08_07345 [Akkermansiaceae bacterium]|nr:hypothetical protein [Akkermansiaceae bacterium]